MSTEVPDLAAFLAECGPLIDATVAMTGRPREVYEQYLTAPPAPGVTWSTALPERKKSLITGPLPPDVARELSQMAPTVASTPQAPKRTTGARAA